MTNTQAILAPKMIVAGQILNNYAVLFRLGKIHALVHSDNLPPHANIEELHGGILVPGFVDTQVNGGGGILFNDTPTVEGIKSIAKAHRKFGTTALLPTLISDNFDVIRKGLGAIEQAIEDGVPGVVGIHVEGPFLNPEKRGIHDASKFRRLDIDAIELLSSMRRGKTLVTIAPENASPGLISELRRRGIIVAAGHSLATYDEIKHANAEGLSGVTHLFNAMSQLGSREPGVVGAALDFGLTCGLIADGYHVHEAAMRAAYQMIGAEKLMLVTDAMPSVGHADNGFYLGENWISSASGALRDKVGTLAGSNLNMALAIRNAMSMMRIDLASAVRMASATPARFLGLEERLGTIAPGLNADFVHLDDELHPRSVWIGGAKQ
ncbi:N-acetylglucosamine-6-phosphate deacetylase [Aquidulcibacter paucihalophilus]|uniref:N-acetylglucosamine-6-phosphate deacetylase n=1 Tax=Aquidulcibacter paucihalophilus TaxID=1978549 RepID=UPI000A191B2A|nr:N-acetylglucosamine-6-phosphate deacetylase [Aquidulcibacter paucihalophilus]